MENNNGKGIFYGVIGVATLVVAIIGATFAFFSATANTTNANQAQANSVNLAGTLSITGEADFRTSMIPVSKANMYSSYELGGANHCKGYSATATTTGSPLYDLCSTYDFTIYNSADVAQTVYFTFTSSTNTFGTDGNLTYCLYHSGTVTDAGELVECKKVPAQGSSDERIWSETIPAKTGGTNGSVSYTIVLYINEINDDQTSADAGKAFVGTISASTAGGSSNVTGVVTGLS